MHISVHLSLPSVNRGARPEHDVLDVVWSKQTVEELLLCPWMTLKSITEDEDIFEVIIYI